MMLLLLFLLCYDVAALIVIVAFVFVLPEGSGAGGIMRVMHYIFENIYTNAVIWFCAGGKGSGFEFCVIIKPTRPST